MMENAHVVSATPEFSTPAIFSLIFAVLAWTVLPFMGMLMATMSPVNMFGMPLTGSVIASVCAWIAQRRIRRSGGTLRGAGLAKAARILTITQYVLFAIVLLFGGLSLWTNPVLEHHVTVSIPR